mgnify:CR=1 FL=1
MKREKGELVDDMRDHPDYKASVEEPKVSILPIGAGGDSEKEDRLREAAQILVGKDPKQVEEAIAQASVLGETVRNVRKLEEEL